MSTFQNDQGGRQYYDSHNIIQNQPYNQTPYSYPINQYQRQQDTHPTIYPYQPSNHSNIQNQHGSQYPQNYSQIAHQYDNNSMGHPQFQSQFQNQIQNRGQPVQNANYHSQQRNPIHQEQIMLNQNQNFGNNQDFQNQRNYLDNGGSYPLQNYDKIDQSPQYKNMYSYNQNQNEYPQRQQTQGNQNQQYNINYQQNQSSYSNYPGVNENQGIYQNQQLNNQRSQNYNQNIQNGQILQYSPADQNEYYRMQQMQQFQGIKQDCDMTQSFYYENGKHHSSSQTTIIQQTLQNQQMNPLSFKNKFQLDPSRVQQSQPQYNPYIQSQQYPVSERFNNQEHSQHRINNQNQSNFNQQVIDFRDQQIFSEKQDFRNEYDNQIFKYNEIQQSTQSISARKMNEDIFQTKQNSQNKINDQYTFQQNSIIKDQQQRINGLLQNNYVMERNLNAGFETNTSDTTNKQQQINNAINDKFQNSGQIQETQNSLKQNIYQPTDNQIQQHDQQVQRETQELKSKNNDQLPIRQKQIMNYRRRFSTKSVKIKSGKSLKDISDINLCEGLSESKFEEDPQFYDEEFAKKGSNQDIKNLNLNQHKFSQFKMNQVENQREISDEKSISQKHTNAQLKLKLLQKLQQTNNTKSYDISLHGQSEIKQLSSKTSLQNQDKIGISKSDIEKIKQKSLTKFDNNSTKVDPLVKMLQQKSREDSLIEHKEKVYSKDTISSKKRCNSLKIQDSLIEHVRQNGFQEGFSKQTGESPQNIQEKPQNQLPPIAHPVTFQKNNLQDTSQTSYMQKSLYQHDKMQLYNIKSQDNLPDFQMYSHKRMSKQSIKSSNLFAYSDTRSLIHPNQIHDPGFQSSLDRQNSKIFDKNQDKDFKNQIEQINNYKQDEDIYQKVRNQSNQQLTQLIDRWGIKVGNDSGAALNQLINQQTQNQQSNDQQQVGFILKENKVQKNLESFKTVQQAENQKNPNSMKPLNGKPKMLKTPNYPKEKLNKNSNDRKKIKQHSQNEDNQSSSSLSLSFTYNQTINQNENNVPKDNDSSNKIKFVGLSEQINLDTSLTPNQNPHTPIQNAKKVIQKQVENIKNIPPAAIKIAKDPQVQLNQLIQVKSGSFQESGANENYSFKTPVIKNRQLKTKSKLLKKPSFENNMKSSQGENLKSFQSNDKDQMLFKNNLSSIRNSDEINKMQTDSFELNKDKVIVQQMPPVSLLDCKTIMNNKDETNISDCSGMPAPKRQLERTYSDISKLSNNLYPELKQNKFDDMKTLINEKQHDDNQSSLSAIQPYAPLREIEKSQSDISYVSRFGYNKKYSDNQLAGCSDIKTVQNHAQNDDQISDNSDVQAPQRIIERTLSDISQISQISKISNNLQINQNQRPKNQFEDIPKLKKDKNQKLPKHKQSKKQNDEYFIMKNQVIEPSQNSLERQLKQNVVQDQYQQKQLDILNKQNSLKLSEFKNIYEAKKIMENNYLSLTNDEISANKIDDRHTKEEKQTNKKSSLNLPSNYIFGKPALSQQSSINLYNKQNSKYTASFTLNKDSVVISQKSASSYKEENNQINIVQSWSALNSFGHINSGFYLKNPSKDLPRIEISEEDENENDPSPIKGKDQQSQNAMGQNKQSIVHIADVEPGQQRRMSLANQDEPIKMNNIFQLRRGLLAEQPEMSEKNSNNALAQSGFFGRYSSNPNLLNFKFQ